MKAAKSANEKIPTEQLFIAGSPNSLLQARPLSWEEQELKKDQIRGKNVELVISFSDSLFKILLKISLWILFTKCFSNRLIKELRMGCIFCTISYFHDILNLKGEWDVLN